MEKEETDSACRDASSSQSAAGESFLPLRNPSSVFISGPAPHSGERVTSFIHSSTAKTSSMIESGNAMKSQTGMSESSNIVTTESIGYASSGYNDVVVGTIKYIGEGKWGKNPHKFRSSSPEQPLSNARLSSTQSVQSNARHKPSSFSSDRPHSTVSNNDVTSTFQSLSDSVTTAEQTYISSSSDSLVLKSAADCLHAQDFIRMLETLRMAPSDSVAILFGRGLAFFKLRKYSEAESNFTKMLQVVASTPSQHASKYLAEYYLGEISLSRKKFDEAAELYGKSAKSYLPETVAVLYRMVQPSLASVYSKQGSALRQVQLIIEAVHAYKAALHHTSTKKDKLAVHTSLGNLYQSLGENKSALEQYEATVRLADQLGDFVSMGWAHGNMGNAYLGLYDKDKAIQHLEKSLELAIKYEPTPQAIGRAYNNLGTAYQSCNKLDKAEEYYDLALSQAIYGMDSAGEARVRGNYGNLLMLKKEFDPAISHYTETLVLTSDRSTKTTALHNRGCAYYERGEAEKKKLLKHDNSDKEKFYVTYNGPVAKKEERDLVPTRSMRISYSKGAADLSEVVQYHEETFQTMKGSQHGLNLSVSLFETSARTFHRLQDCHYSQLDWDRALECAEQSRARTLGELLLDRKYGQLDLQLVSPLKVSQIQEIVKLPGEIVVFVSYTGARLLAWVFVPLESGEVVTNTFQVMLEEDQFDGHSLDYFLRYTLAEVLNEKEVDMYTPCSYEKSPLTKLYHLFAVPLASILERISDTEQSTSSRDIIVIPDSYTNLMPMFALFSSEGQFLGDKFYFRIMPSLLTLGILSQLPPAVVSVPEDSKTFCIVGNPTIPSFKYEGDTWNLGKLPFATQEAESVAHILNCQPTLHEEATKNVVTSMIRNAKVVHLATHGSAVAGFLAFAGLGSSLGGAVTTAKTVLLYPEEVEKMSISPALVVLSSCDSGRGMVKADGIQGMARAFILAGAQAVLTTLWRVPDESAAVFMKFFYQYMMDGFKASHSLQKAMLSIRSFHRYSKYIHWSGYQLTGREVEFQVTKETAKIGPCPVFPRLEVVNKLEKVLVKNRFFPTDVQVIHGPPGLRPLEPVLQFVQRNHTHFPGGVYYVSALNNHFYEGAEEAVCRELSGSSKYNDKDDDLQVLLIIDGLTKLPEEPSFLTELMAKNTTHIIFTIESKFFTTEKLKREVDHSLLRGMSEISLDPLTELHVTQRLVHGIMTKCEFTPYNAEQDILADVAEKSLGSPDLVDVISALLSRFIDKGEEGESSAGFLDSFNAEICSVVCSRNCSVSYSTGSSIDDDEEVRSRDTGIGGSLAEAREALETVQKLNTSTSRVFDGDFISHLIDSFHFTKPDFLMLATLSLFNGAPLPFSLVQQVQSLVQDASPGESLSPIQTLLSASLLHRHPSPVIVKPLSPSSLSTVLIESSYYHVPLIVSETVNEHLKKEDLLFSLTLACSSLQKITATLSPDKTLRTFLTGLLHSILKEAEKVEDIYSTIFRMYLTFNN